jgi:hypothetical protein
MDKLFSACLIFCLAAMVYYNWKYLEKDGAAMSIQLSLVYDLKTQLRELGFAPAQIDRIIKDIIGTARIEYLSTTRLDILARELDKFIWFSKRCQSIT